MKQFIIIASLIFNLEVQAADFPLRAEYPTVKPIETAELNKIYKDAIIVDVRSKFEYEVVHMSSAQHVPMNNKTVFLEKVGKLRDKTNTKPLVFYCNGIKCKKSYDAAKDAVEAGFKSVFCYDAGVISWLKAYPDKTFLLGKTPANPNKVISGEAFKSKLVGLSEFQKAASDKDALIFDVRDASQHTSDKRNIANVKSLPLDNLLPLIKQGKFRDKKLYFMDAVGKQVEWLQYHLEDQGYKNYYFLNGGIEGK